ncbi:hypothetical protein SAMN05444920_102787 [Nonomuraea solani]|uniref:Uncharacterized protein n=1 Tax=Nonomuraea solani TaxID=1144553 RepID=A0A1H5ZNA6_9ACTN|nr:hypothetical protein [Nonomuraea solani]SEG37899.1 hypothetical protein SAMN05444920_102787 [Nonomuraea solani]
MIAVVVSLVAVVLLVLVVVALGMRSMSRRESSLPPERLKEMAEKEEMTHARSTDEFAAHEPRMNNFSPDFSPIDEVKQKPVRTGQRGRRGVDEWGNPNNDDDDEEFWANIRSDAEEGGFGAGGTVAARKAASRPVERERPTEQRPAAEQRPAEAERPAAKRAKRSAKPQPAAASASSGYADPNAATVQAPLPQRPAPQRQAPAAAASSNLADLVEPVQRITPPTQAEMADQRTMTFAAPTADVMSILGAGAQPVPAPTSRPASVSSNSIPASPGTGYAPLNGSGAFPAVSPASSGNFPAAQPAPIHGAPTSDPFPAYNGAADPLETTWTNQPAASANWPTPPDILDDPAPAASDPYSAATSWPAFEQPAGRPPAYPASYEVRSGWAVADDSDPLTGPSPATSTPTVPGRAVGAYDDVLSLPPTSVPTPPSPFGMGAYETGDITTSPAAAWPEPPSGNGAQAGRPAQGNGGNHRRAPEQDYPHDYYR